MRWGESAPERLDLKFSALRYFSLLLLVAGLMGCGEWRSDLESGAESLGDKASQAKAELKKHGVEVKRGKVMRVFRF